MLMSSASRRIFYSICMAIFLVGCGSEPGPDAIAGKYMDAMLKGDKETAWDLLAESSQQKFDQLANSKKGMSGFEWFSKDKVANRDLDGLQYQIIRTRKFKDVPGAQCLISITDREKTSVGYVVMMLAHESTGWKVIETMAERDAIEEMTLAVQPGERGNYDNTFIRKLISIQPDSDRVAYVDKLRGEKITLTGKVKGVASNGPCSAGTLLMTVAETKGSKHKDNEIRIFVNLDWWYYRGTLYYTPDMIAKLETFENHKLTIKPGDQVTVTGVIARYSDEDKEVVVETKDNSHEFDRYDGSLILMEALFLEVANK